MIHFIPNDPQDTVMPMRKKTPRLNRPANRAGFTFFGEEPEDTYDPGTQTSGFLFWQCREAALAALESWEDVSGVPFTSWQGPTKKIELRPDDGVDLNAYYNRASLSFFHFPAGSTKFLSGASTDVVAHEAGHGILDAIRPELITSSVFEENAFHEAFGDCVAILTALLDGPTRTAVRPLLTEKNLVEGTIETLAAGIKSINANHNAAVPRRALNKFKWQLPSTLPDFGSAGDGPGKLINEIHSFGQVFTGCFYDTIVNIFQAQGGTTDAALLAAVRTSGRLLAQAVATAPLNPRFFREVGRAMVKADEQENAGANRDAIKAGFEAHDIPLGTGAMLAPVAALAGAAPSFKAAAVSLPAAAMKDLRSRIGAIGGKLATSALRIGGETVAEVIHQRVVSLDRLDKNLKGVVARASEAILVGESGGRAAILSALPEAAIAVDEVETFVWSLLKQGAIDFGNTPKGAVALAAANAAVNPVTHTIKMIGGKKVLTRFRFACQCQGVIGQLTSRVPLTN
ncbi:MAG: M36 family metallopeptidase [Planctomycetota bacterium]